MIRRFRRALFEMRMQGVEPTSIHLNEEDLTNLKAEAGFRWNDELNPEGEIPIIPMKRKAQSHVRGPQGRIVALVSEAVIEREQQEAISRAQGGKSTASARSRSRP